MNIEQIAELAHEANRVYCRLIGDYSQPLWKDAPNWQKNSAIHGVEFHLNNPDSSPEQSHEEWLKVKESEGWKYGPVKNVEKKEHPCCKPYIELPIKQRIKDTLFTSIVFSMKNLVGLVDDIVVEASE